MGENQENTSVMHIASLVLGIISIVSAVFWYLSIPTGILAIVLGIKSAKKTGSKIAKAGMVTGIVGLSLVLLLYIGMLGLIFLSNIY